MQTAIYETQPKSFQRTQKGLLELQTQESPLQRKPMKYELMDLEREKGYRIQTVKFNDKFYIYKVL